MRKIIWQCISYVTMRCDISMIDRQMMNRITGFLSLDFSDPIPHRFDRCMGIQHGDIVSPRCLLTESDISACLSPTKAIGIQVTLGWFTCEPFKGPVALFDCIFENAEVLGIVSSAMSFKLEVNKDMGSSASAMVDWCRRVLHRCWNCSQFALVKQMWSTILQTNWKVVTTTRIRTNSPGETLQRVKCMEVKVPLV